MCNSHPFKVYVTAWQALQQAAVALGEPLPGDWRALAATATVQKLPYVLGLSLLCMSLDEWEQVKLPCLQRAICHALHIRYTLKSTILHLLASRA